tara:strand:- start:931 stop:1446 length:516 start_codon:yes stop_codon:yes gene_type:complete
MPTGLKQSSSVVSIGFSVDEAGPNTFTQTEVDLNLSPLDREVFVVLAINLDTFTPDNVPTVDTRTNSSVTTTRQTAVIDINNSNCLAAQALQIKQDAAGVLSGVGFTSQALETPPSTLEYIGIIATNDFFVQMKGTGNLIGRGMAGRMWGYRAVADASIYAALVQSEVLSA